MQKEVLLLQASVCVLDAEEWGYLELSVIELPYVPQIEQLKCHPNFLFLLFTDVPPWLFGSSPWQWGSWHCCLCVWRCSGVAGHMSGRGQRRGGCLGWPCWRCGRRWPLSVPIVRRHIQQYSTPQQSSICWSTLDSKRSSANSPLPLITLLDFPVFSACEKKDVENVLT